MWSKSADTCVQFNSSKIVSWFICVGTYCLKNDTCTHINNYDTKYTLSLWGESVKKGYTTTTQQQWKTVLEIKSTRS